MVKLFQRWNVKIQRRKDDKAIKAIKVGVTSDLKGTDKHMRVF